MVRLEAEDGAFVILRSVIFRNDCILIKFDFFADTTDVFRTSVWVSEEKCVVVL